MTDAFASLDTAEISPLSKFEWSSEMRIRRNMVKSFAVENKDFKTDENEAGRRVLAFAMFSMSSACYISTR